MKDCVGSAREVRTRHALTVVEDWAGGCVSRAPSRSLFPSFRTPVSLSSALSCLVALLSSPDFLSQSIQLLRSRPGPPITPILFLFRCGTCADASSIVTASEAPGPAPCPATIVKTHLVDLSEREKARVEDRLERCTPNSNQAKAAAAVVCSTRGFCEYKNVDDFKIAYQISILSAGAQCNANCLSAMRSGMS